MGEVLWCEKKERGEIISEMPVEQSFLAWYGNAVLFDLHIRKRKGDWRGRIFEETRNHEEEKHGRL